MSTADEINKLKKLFDEGTITEEEFNTGKQNILKADVLELDTITKDTKIFMYDSKKKVNVKGKN